MKIDRTQYVAGFLFGRPDQVVLIRKNRPDWQTGKLNAVGGKVEPGELIRDAMVREFREETGVEFLDWKYFVCLEGNDDFHSYYWRVHFFYGQCVDAIHDVRTVTDEEIVWASLSGKFPRDTLPNLKWLIPMAQTMMLREESCESFYIRENAGKWA